MTIEECREQHWDDKCEEKLICSNCEYDIGYLEDYVEINGVRYCLECLKDMDIRDLLGLFDVDIQTRN